VGESPTRRNAPAGCNRSNCGGNETVEAFGEAVTKYGDGVSVQAVTRVNAEQASKRTMRGPTRELWPYAVAQAHAFRNERQQAFDWLNRAYEARDSDLQFVRNDPLLASIRADMRYRKLLRKTNLPE
jgi:hypothetical protein